MLALMLGLVAGVIGVVETLLDMTNNQGFTPGFTWHGIGALVFSVVSIAFAFSARKRPTMAGLGMYGCAVGGFICATFSYIPPGVLLLISGSVALFMKTTGTDDDE